MYLETTRRVFSWTEFRISTITICCVISTDIKLEVNGRVLIALVVATAELANKDQKKNSLITSALFSITTNLSPATVHEPDCLLPHRVCRPHRVCFPFASAPYNHVTRRPPRRTTKNIASSSNPLVRRRIVVRQRARALSKHGHAFPAAVDGREYKGYR